MSFSDPITWSTNARVTRNQLNVALRDNMNALKDPPTSVYTTAGLSSDYSTTSTSFTNVDGTNMALTITTTGNGAAGNGDVMIWLTGTVYTSGAARVYFRILEDGSTLNIDGDGLLVSEGTGVRPVSFMFLRANATAAAHTYTLQWKVNTGTAVLLANVGTSTRDCKAQFGVREVS